MMDEEKLKKAIKASAAPKDFSGTPARWVYLPHTATVTCRAQTVSSNGWKNAGSTQAGKTA
jgi:hypothetical protein